MEGEVLVTRKSGRRRGIRGGSWEAKIEESMQLWV